MEIEEIEKLSKAIHVEIEKQLWRRIRVSLGLPADEVQLDWDEHQKQLKEKHERWEKAQRQGGIVCLPLGP